MKIKLTTLRIPSLPKEKPNSLDDLLFIGNQNTTIIATLNFVRLKLLGDVDKVILGFDKVENTSDRGQSLTLAEEYRVGLMCPVVNGSIPERYLPTRPVVIAYVSSVINLPVTGQTGIIYVMEDTNKSYRWATTRYVLLSASIVIGTGFGHATDGAIGADALFHTRVRSAHGVGPEDIGLSNVDNTVDLEKPLSSSQATHINNKADLVGGFVPNNQLPEWVDDVLTFTTYNALPSEGERGKLYCIEDSGFTYRWSGTIYILAQNRVPRGTTSGTALPSEYGLATAVLIEDANEAMDDTVSPHASSTSNPHLVTSATMGLNHVTNTSDIDLPLSRAGMADLATRFQLDTTGKIPASRLPGFVDDILEFPDVSDFPTVGVADKIYVDNFTNEMFRWDINTYVKISTSLNFGLSSGTAMEATNESLFVKPSDLVTVNTGNATSDPMSERMIRTVIDDSKLWGNEFLVDSLDHSLHYTGPSMNLLPIAKDSVTPWTEKIVGLDMPINNFVDPMWWANTNGHAVIGKVGDDRYDIDADTGHVTKMLNHWTGVDPETIIQHHDQFLSKDINNVGSGFWVHDAYGKTQIAWPDVSINGIVVSYGSGVCIQTGLNLHVYEGPDIKNPISHTLIPLFSVINQMGVLGSPVGQDMLTVITSDFNTAVFDVVADTWTLQTNHSQDISKSTFGPAVRGYQGFGIDRSIAHWSNMPTHYLRTEGDGEFLEKYSLGTQTDKSAGYVCGWHFYGPISPLGYCVRSPQGVTMEGLTHGLSCPDTENEKGYCVYQDKIVTMDLSGCIEGMPPAKFRNQAAHDRIPLRPGIIHWVDDELRSN